MKRITITLTQSEAERVAFVLLNAPDYTNDGSASRIDTRVMHRIERAAKRDKQQWAIES